MGQLREPHESSASDALKTFDTLSKIGTRVSAAGTAAKNATTSATNAENRQGELTQSVANSEIRQKEQDIKNVKETYSRYSTYYNGLGENEQKMFKTSDQYKEMQKFFKGFKDIAPGMINDQGDIVAASNKSIYADKLNEVTAQAKQAVANGTANQEQVNLVKLSKAGGVDHMAEAIDFAEDKMKERGKTAQAEADAIAKANQIPSQFEQDVKAWWSKFTQKKQANAAIDRGQPPAIHSTNTNALAPEGANTNDPLGILGGR